MAEQQAESEKCIIVCPLRFERSLLIRFGVEEFAEIHCCGPGADAVRNWVDALKSPDNCTIWLVGVAGGLSPKAVRGKAFLVQNVVDASLLKPGFQFTRCGGSPRGNPGLTAIACSTNHPIATIEQKRAMHERTAADLVDMESYAFAEAATAHQLNWVIIRGVSDGPSDTLPAAMADFVDAQGRTRLGSVLWNLLKRPALLKNMLRLRKASMESMRGAAALLRDIYKLQ